MVFPERYFSDIQSVYTSPRRPTTREMMASGVSPGPGQLVDVQAIDVKHAFLKLNPALPDASLRVNVASGNRLKELWVCLTKELKPMSCPAGGTPDTQRIRIRTPHQ